MCFNIIKKLERIIAKEGLNVIDTNMDDTSYVTAVQTECNGVFVIFFDYDDFLWGKKYALKMYQLKEHVPFDTVSPNVRVSFFDVYNDIIKKSGKVVRFYGEGFSPKQFPGIVRCSARV